MCIIHSFIGFVECQQSGGPHNNHHHHRRHSFQWIKDISQRFLKCSIIIMVLLQKLQISGLISETTLHKIAQEAPFLKYYMRSICTLNIQEFFFLQQDPSFPINLGSNPGFHFWECRSSVGQKTPN